MLTARPFGLSPRKALFEFVLLMPVISKHLRGSGATRPMFMLPTSSEAAPGRSPTPGRSPAACVPSRWEAKLQLALFAFAVLRCALLRCLLSCVVSCTAARALQSSPSRKPGCR